jgi:hypothetical protein
MSKKRYASYYGKYDSSTGVLPFGTTVNDGSASAKSGLSNMIQTSIIRHEKPMQKQTCTRAREIRN